MKNKRNIKTFVPEQDVLEMLDKATQNGLLMGDILNQAVREYGQKVIRRLANDRVSKLKNLVGSFPDASRRNEELSLAV